MTDRRMQMARMYFKHLDRSGKPKVNINEPNVYRAWSGEVDLDGNRKILFESYRETALSAVYELFGMSENWAHANLGEVVPCKDLSNCVGVGCSQSGVFCDNPLSPRNGYIERVDES